VDEVEALSGLEHGLLAVELLLAGEVAVALLAGLVVLQLSPLLEVEPLVKAIMVRVLLLQNVSLRELDLVGVYRHLDFLHVRVVLHLVSCIVSAYHWWLRVLGFVIYWFS
jgi:hypothetical protein